MNRRDFTRLSALTLAASQFPQKSPAQSPGAASKPVGFAPVGLGAISGIFSQALQSTRKAKLVAVVTGHPDTKGKTYSSKYNFPASSIYTYDTYAKIRDNRDIEAVYIGLPNSMHSEYTIRAAEAGKHVLCEKPMAISSAECRRMIDACRAHNVHLMIAYRIWYDPTFALVLDIIKRGDLGQIKSFQGQFVANFPTGAWRLNKALAGGGSLFDLGVYPLNTIRYLTGEDPIAYTAVVSNRDKTGRYIGMEESIEWTLKFPSGIIASCSSSYGANGPALLAVRGDRGSITVTGAYGYDGLHATGSANGKQIDIPSTGKQPFQFTLEADHFSDCIRNNKSPKTPGELGLKDLQSIEALYKAAGAPLT
jgi:predicted dehydrogenase